MTPLDPWDGADQFDTLETKFDAVVAAVNAIGAGLDAGTAGQVPRKINSTDFNYEFIIVPTLKTGEAAREKKRIEIGDWNMNTDGTLNVPHGLTSLQWKTMAIIDITIRNDADNAQYKLERVNTAGNVAGGVQERDATNILLARGTGLFFDDANFDSTSYNRGFIDIEYTP